MKQNTKSLPDTDLRGRTRRTPAAVIPRRVTAKLVNGPAAGQTRQVPLGTDTLRVGPWRYRFAGREGDKVLFAKVPSRRVAQKFEMWYIQQYGKHPALAHEEAKRKPVVGKTDVRGRGAKRRREHATAQ